MTISNFIPEQIHNERVAEQWLKTCSDHRGEQIISLAELLTKVQATARAETEQVERRWMWESHGHDGIYGDDGEMQCGECGVDYKRAPIEEVTISYQKARLAVLSKHKVQAAALLEKAAAQVGSHCRECAKNILSLIPTDYAAALAERDKQIVELAEQALYLELESAVRNHLKNHSDLGGDPFFALQNAFTLCRRGSSAPVERERKARLEEAEWWAGRSGMLRAAQKKRLAELRAAAERGKELNEE